jgi:hypothetical protein
MAAAGWKASKATTKQIVALATSKKCDENYNEIAAKRVRVF